VRANIKFDPAMHDEGYVLVTTETSHTTLRTGAGIYYGAQTIKQLIDGRGADAVLHSVIARDWLP